MAETSGPSYEKLRPLYDDAKQGHVFTFYDSLSPAEQTALLEQLATIDPHRVNGIYQLSTKAAEDEKAALSSGESTKLEPPPAEAVGSTLSADSAEQVAAWKATGMEAIAKGEVAVLLLAGGQGTRLGSSAPKGCYDIGLPSHSSLFQLQAERIKKLQELAGGHVRWYVMTSGPTRKDTEDAFKAAGFWGLQEKDVVFFEQGVLPCLTPEGKILLATKSSVAVAPDGNGGLYAALRSPLAPGSPSVLDDLSQRGVKYLHAYCVDNALARVGDPVFLGFCIAREAACGAKVVVKTDPKESVGVVAVKGGKFAVVEYSEIPASVAAEKDGDQLRYRAANIANHFYSLEFLERICSPTVEDQLAYHIASKKIPTIDLGTGESVKPEKPNGLKLELFIFDVFPLVPAGKMGVLEVPRSQEFSPLKNAPGTGSDDPGTSRRDLLAEHKRWIEAAGAELAEGVEVEISPNASVLGEGLEKIKGKKVVRGGWVRSKVDWVGLVE